MYESCGVLSPLYVCSDTEHCTNTSALIVANMPLCCMAQKCNVRGCVGVFVGGWVGVDVGVWVCGWVFVCTWVRACVG